LSAAGRCGRRERAETTPAADYTSAATFISSSAAPVGNAYG
jgi:hypothetical protein